MLQLFCVGECVLFVGGLWQQQRCVSEAMSNTLSESPKALSLQDVLCSAAISAPGSLGPVGKMDYI